MEFKIQLLLRNVFADEIELLPALHGEETQIDGFVVLVLKTNRKGSLVPDFGHQIEMFAVVIELFDGFAFPDVFQVHKACGIEGLDPSFRIRSDQIGSPVMGASDGKSHVVPFRKKENEQSAQGSKKDADDDQDVEQEERKGLVFLI